MCKVLDKHIYLRRNDGKIVYATMSEVTKFKPKSVTSAVIFQIRSTEHDPDYPNGPPYVIHVYVNGYRGDKLVIADFELSSNSPIEIKLKNHEGMDDCDLETTEYEKQRIDSDKALQKQFEKKK